MNKTVNINLAGQLFHIDENAYEVLYAYLNSIKKSLKNAEEMEEIYRDIEARIAELFSNKQSNPREVVNLSMVEAVMETMGTPEDFIDEENEENATESSSNQHVKKAKKLFRDPDQKILGGVASGLGHYFGIDPVWMRVAFLIVLLLGLGFIAIVYFAFWIIIPKASTTAEKLAMKGEPINISNIEKTIKKEFNEMGSKIKNTKIKDLEPKIKRFGDFIKNFGLHLLSFLRKFLGILLIFFSCIIIGSSLIFYFSGPVFISSLDDLVSIVPNWLIFSIIPFKVLAVFVLIAIIAPLILLFLLGVRILTNGKRKFKKPLTLSLFGLWILAVLVLSFAGADFNSNSNFTGNNTELISLDVVKNDTIYIKMIDNENLSNHNQLRKRFSNELIIDKNSNSRVYSNEIELNIKKSNSEKPQIKIRKFAEGKSHLEATESAKNIQYDFKLFDDTLALNGYFLGDKEDYPKDLEIKIDISLPENVHYVIDPSAKSFLDNELNYKFIKKEDIIIKKIKINGI